MIASRGLFAMRMLSSPLLRNTSKLPISQTLRKSSDWSYRTGATIRPRINLYADIIGGIMFWWVLWHIYHDYGHIIGEFDYPDPSSWTNAELGIPPDSAED